MLNILFGIYAGFEPYSYSNEGNVAWNSRSNWKSIQLLFCRSICNCIQVLFLAFKVIVTVISYNLEKSNLKVFKYLLSLVIVLVFRYIFCPLCNGLDVTFPMQPLTKLKPVFSLFDAKWLIQKVSKVCQNMFRDRYTSAPMANVLIGLL